MKPKTGNYILSSVVTLLALIFLTVLITARPGKPDTEYWIKLGVVIIGGLVGLLSFPFMRRTSDLAVLPESFLKPILLLALIAVFGILAFVALSAAINGRYGVTVLLGLFLFGLGRAIHDFWRLKPKSRKPSRKRSAKTPLSGEGKGSDGQNG